MTDTLILAGLWVGFAASHIVLSSTAVRPRLVATLGEQGYAGVFSLVSLGFFVPLAWTYFGGAKHTGPLLWALPIGELGRWLLYIGNGVAFVLLAAGLVTPSAASMGQEAAEPRGAHFITRYPLVMGIGLWGLLHLPVNGYASDVAFFAGFPLFAVLGCWHQDQRKRATQDGYRAWCDQTPFLPFSGRQLLRGLREISPIALVVGLALTVGLRWFHSPLFGP